MTRATTQSAVCLPFAASGGHTAYLHQIMPVVGAQLRRVVAQLGDLPARYPNKTQLSGEVQRFMRKAAPFAREEYVQLCVVHLTTALSQSVEQALEDFALDLYADYLYSDDDRESVAAVVKVLSNA